MLEYKIKNFKNQNKANVQWDYGGNGGRGYTAQFFSKSLLKHGIILLSNPIRIPRIIQTNSSIFLKFNKSLIEHHYEHTELIKLNTMICDVS